MNNEGTRQFSYKNNAVRVIRPILNIGPVQIFLPAKCVGFFKHLSQPVESGELWTALDLGRQTVPVI
jgi:hypothetical protein